MTQRSSRSSASATATIKGCLAPAGLLAFMLTACSPRIPSGAFVLTQSPVVPSTQPGDCLDGKYPSGTRVVMVDPKFEQFTVLSRGLSAAGDPQISYDATRVFFSGKPQPGADWQIYAVKLPGGAPLALTSMPGGAMNPVLLPDGEFAFISPVPKNASSTTPGAIYVSSLGGQPRRLTFSSAEVSEPTLLADGRILFVSHRRGATTNDAGAFSLCTINNDGTEITEFASLPDPGRPLERPRELPHGRIVFLLGENGPSSTKHEVHFVRSSRPFSGSERLLKEELGAIFSVEPAEGALLLCANALPPTQPSSSANVALYHLADGAVGLAAPLYVDPKWNCLEALERASRRRPMGRLSNVDPSDKTGQILCLNANFTHAQPAGSPGPTAARVRVLAQLPGDDVRNLGEVPLQTDGSFMAEVPADVALGFETLDSGGRVLQRLEPGIWVRPGENRSCIGCHEPHNQAPRNVRPLAVRAPVPHLRLETLHVAQQKR